MAHLATVSADAATWTQITDADATSITFQNRSEYDCYIAVTTDETEPTDLSTAVKYGPGQGENSLTLSTAFDGTSGADRVWVYARNAI